MRAIRVPDLSDRPLGLTVEREFPVGAAALYDAWTKRFDLWFAARGSVLMRAAVNAPFFFEAEQRAEGQAVAERHPHYGRFLQLVPDTLIQLTWVTGAAGTGGAETVITVELEPTGGGTRLRLTHAGFYDHAARDRHQQAWPVVLEQLERKLE